MKLLNFLKNVQAGGGGRGGGPREKNPKKGFQDRCRGNGNKRRIKGGLGGGKGEGGKGQAGYSNFL